MPGGQSHCLSRSVAPWMFSRSRSLASRPHVATIDQERDRFFPPVLSISASF